MGRKHIRSNYYKNSAAKKRNRILKRLVFCIKTAGLIVTLQLVSFVFLFSYDFLTQCDYFRAEKLVVTGTDMLSEKHVLEHLLKHGEDFKKNIESSSSISSKSSVTKSIYKLSDDKYIYRTDDLKPGTSAIYGIIPEKIPEINELLDIEQPLIKKLREAKNA